MGFTVGSTAFGLFDSDTQFQSDADKVLEYVRRNIGDPVLDIQMSASMVYEAFEQACMEYSSIINQYQAKSALVTFLGAPTTSTSGSENTYPTRNLEFLKKMAEPYGEEAGVGGSLPWHSGTIGLVAGQQKYDLQALLSGSGALTGSNANARIQVRRIHHYSPLSAYRFFGTNSSLNYLNNEFHFESFTPETIFYLLPIWEDILRGMQFETSNRVRRSQYSYEIHNNVLTLYPTPVQAIDLWVEYTLPANITNDGGSKVANLSNVPFGFISYSSINSVGKTWVWRMALAFSKEMEGLLRRKASPIPIPNGDLTLDGDALVSDGKSEQDALRTELRAILDELTYDKLQARQMEMSDAIERQLAKVPLGIYVG
jgi:hypothetical protein